jgi:hypothetical protein
LRIPRGSKGWCIGVLVIAGSAYLGHRLLRGDARIFLPGETSHGHHQIELRCEVCHTEPFAGQDAMQKACVECHGAELAAAEDSHPKSKFTDPRNADRVALLDARTCVACHREHVPEQTSAMGLTLPGDYCYRCHAEIGDERASHAGLGFETCASGGCHNFHDNRALYQDFLVEHADEPWLREPARLPARDPERFADERHAPLTLAAADARAGGPALAAEWAVSSHARSGVNCSACHAPAAAGAPEPWTDHPGVEGCRGCHADEVQGFLAGRHGMRIAEGLPPMTPAQARIPMRADAEGEIGCASCHAAHAFEPRREAAAEACLRCHDDAHSRAWPGSPHATLFEAELAGALPPGSGVSCASCHLPRLPAGRSQRVQHDQNHALRPNEKQIRAVCMHCHGLAFSIDALADAQQIRTNFRGRPRHHVESIEMAVREAQNPNEEEVP